MERASRVAVATCVAGVVAVCALVEQSAAQPAVPKTAGDVASHVAMERPNPEGGPTPVIIGLYVIDIAKIDDVDQSFTADFAIRLTWNDPRLVADIDDVRIYTMDEVWNPRITVLNRRRLFRTWPDTLRVDPQGNVQYRQRFWGQLAARRDLHDFPFDRNPIRIILVAPELLSNELEFVNEETTTGRSEEFSLVDAWVDEGTVDSGAYFFAPGQVHLPTFTYEFNVGRYTAYYLWKIILPLGIIVMMSWIVFWIDPEQLGPQIGLAATAVLTLIAYRFLLGSLVPKVSYLTRMDFFIMGATILVFLALVEAITTARMAHGDRADLGRRIDTVSRVAFPMVFLVVVLLAFFLP